jgi:hypothetical protein
VPPTGLRSPTADPATCRSSIRATCRSSIRATSPTIRATSPVVDPGHLADDPATCRSPIRASSIATLARLVIADSRSPPASRSWHLANRGTSSLRDALVQDPPQRRSMLMSHSAQAHG